jgi:hypothetical protein
MKINPQKQPPTREDRVAAALRENLRKRKIQAQAQANQAQKKDAP